jgi:phenylalanyl-tRNA synthetase beta chain
MKFTLGWLKAHLETDASLEQILAALNDIGIEVEGVDNPADKLSGFRIAKVLTAAPHPQADKLRVPACSAFSAPRARSCPPMAWS